jgi:hypothetical protein
VPRASCTPATAIPPSPTAAAQRFTDPERTSPAAKIPGQLVSSGRQPICAGLRTDYGKNGRCFYNPPVARLRIFELDRFEHLIARHLPNLGVGQKFDVFARLHATREIARHAFRKIVAAYDEQHLRRAFGEKHRGLSCRITAASDDHSRASTELTFKCRRGVVNPRALELLATVCIQSPVAARDTRGSMQNLLRRIGS